MRRPAHKYQREKRERKGKNMEKEKREGRKNVFA